MAKLAAGGWYSCVRKLKSLLHLRYSEVQSDEMLRILNLLIHSLTAINAAGKEQKLLYKIDSLIKLSSHVSMCSTDLLLRR